MRRSAAPRLVLSLAVIAGVGLVFLLLAGGSSLHLPLTGICDNRLALGAAAGVDEIDVALSPPVELDGLTRSAVLDLRRQAADRYPVLLDGCYVPSPEVFHIADGLPWWGMVGQFYHGKGERSTDGPAEESRFILNPYLLVAAELRGLSIWSDGGRALAWDTSRITGQDLADPDFPFTCRPSSLRWYPRAAQASVTYDVSGCLADLNRWTRYPLGVGDATLDLVAYNARDLGLSYLYLSPTDLDNLAAASPMQAPIAIPQFLHAGDSCRRSPSGGGYPGGCNNMSLRVPELVNIRIERLPARATISLWRDRPADADQRPDMTFTIDFQ